MNNNTPSNPIKKLTNKSCLTISQIINKATKTLKDSNIDNPKLESILLLSYLTSFSKEKIIFYPENLISKTVEKKFFNLVDRRKKHEPISHLIKKREFYNLEFIVNSKVLDPRPDSETLITAISNKFLKDKNLKILDLGTGSGCLIITLLKIFKSWRGLAIDISYEALNVAKKNSIKHRVNSRLKIKKSDLFSNLNNRMKFDIIISNPPYIPSFEIKNLQPEVAIYEPNLALDGGDDGLDFYRKIAYNIKKFLKKNGSVFLEIGINQEEDVIKIFEKFDFYYINYYKDLSGTIRCLEFKYN